MFVTEIEGEEYTYAHCFEEAEDGTEVGCGMEYEFHPDSKFEDDLAQHAPGILRRWHDGVGLVTETRMTADEWNKLVEWHDENCKDKEA